MANKKEYTNEDIVSLKGEDRVRKRPAVIFGSDGLEGCKHSVFEILSNSIDEARDGHGDKIIVTKYNDDSIEVEDFGRGCPVDYNQREKKYNWELVYCELYAGGKYNNNGGDNYEYSLGLNGLGACATQYSSEFMDVEVFRDGYKYDLHFEKGRNVGGLKKEETKQKKTGTKTHWRPDLEVFTDIKIENEYFEDVLKKQAVVNPNITFILRIQRENNSFEEKTFYYENGIADYVAEIAGEKPLTSVQFFTGDRKGRDREDKDDYKVKLSVAFTFSNQVKCLEYYHNSSFLEHGGSPEDAVKSAFTSQINAYLKSNNKYLKNEKPITFQDIEDCLVLVSSSFSTQTSYANQTKKAITNKFIKECMTEFLKHNLEIYFIENPDEAVKIAEQVLVNKRSREKAEKSRIDLKKKLAGSIDLSNQVQKFVDCRSKDLSQRELYIVEGDSALGSVKMARNAEFQAVIPVRGKLQGKTAIENVEKILQTIDKSTFEKIKSTPTTTVEKTTKDTTSTTVSKANTTVTTTAVPTTTKPKEKYPLQSKYKVKFTDSAIKTMTLQSQNDYNKAMQERLTDLGYLASGNATGYFGDMTKTALETFQKNNGLSATGTVDSKTLQVMFSSSAKKV